MSNGQTRNTFPVLKRSPLLRHHRATHVPLPGPPRKNPESASLRPSRPPYLAALLVGLGGLFAGVTGPLLSTFVPILVRDALGDRRSLIGAVMAIDNVLLLLLVPLAGLLSDRARAGGGRRVPIVVAGVVMAAIGMAVFPASAALGIGGLIAAMVLLYTGINLQRSPLHALVADLLPSRYRSLGTASVTFQMCVGAIVFLMLGRALGMRIAFLVAAGTVLVIAATFAWVLREETSPAARPDEAGWQSLIATLGAAIRGTLPGLRAVFFATLLLQLTFQTFSTWFALHATERFAVRPEDVALGFIAWAIGGVIGALPAGALGVRFGRRTAMLLGFGLMCACLLALDRVATLAQAVPLLALASASWTLPTVNAFPLFMEPIPHQHRGMLAAVFLLCMALGGAIGDPLNGSLFDLAGGYRPLFVLMAVYTAFAFLAVLLVPRGAGEANTGPEENFAPRPG
ncbi:Major Facilitator Superfamily protein [Luteitalea pratensis]|uniref:Major Facilitator Superfamily protein n=1 Tax=Luteitalea pratensis TaxID=1855912 RepID=A0A143PMA8_LUTPR|nr:Major Facilitator Superfamily protein [Luteitalea pratensis]